MNGPSDMQPARAEPIRLTYQDYLRFPDDGLRHELIDGEHFVTPTPVLRHQLVSERLGWELGAWVRSSKNGQVFYAPFDVILSDFDVVEPDIMWVSNERRDILKKWAFGAPDLVVEILSPTTRRRDEAHKLRLYDRSGVCEYWLADPDAGTISMYRRSPDGGFPRVADLASADDDTLTTPLLPGLALSLRAVFAD
jgi:Uma2 family endonuclease